MVLMTLVARVADGLPLAASIQDEEQPLQGGRSMVEYQNQAKQICRRLNTQSPSRCTIESGAYYFHYLMANQVVYLVLCERAFSRKLAFLFLEELAGEFTAQYGTRIQTASRPYSFIEFDNFIQKCKKQYTDSRSGAARRNTQLNALSSELQDVQRIAVENIHDVLHRGEALSVLDSKASDLAESSRKYRQEARQLESRSTLVKISFVLLLVVIIFIFIRLYFF